MSDSDKDSNLAKAKVFFERAEEVAATSNFDYAIDMYLEGLRLVPDAVEDGHLPLRAMALVRQEKGGKKPSVMDKMKRHGGKTPLDEMLNATYLLAKDPEHLPYAEMLLKACVAGDYRQAAEWIAQIIFEANRSKAKPSLAIYLLLKDCYAGVEMYSKAVAAAKFAQELKPDDGLLQDEIRDLSAQMVVKEGGYDQEGDFTQSIHDREAQQQLQSQESTIKSLQYREKAVEEARKAVAGALTSQTNILKLANALYDMQTQQSFEDAIGVLEGAYAGSDDFVFKRHEGELRIKKLNSDLRTARGAADAEPENQKLKDEATALARELAETQIQHCRLCVANYPTDLPMKYDYGLCLVNREQYDEAIPYFQQAQKDPRYRIAAMDKTGLCFFLKGWFEDAIDIFSQALNTCQVQDSSIAKELRYNLARSYEENNQADKALELYRRLAQLDFGYKDVQQRVKELRNPNK